MKRLLRDNKRSHFLILISFLVGAAFLCSGSAWGFDSPGLNLNIYAEPGAGGELIYDLGEDSVTLFLVIKNESDRTLVTEQGFSQEELHHALIVTDPNGVRHILKPRSETHRLPIPFFINSKGWSPAEKLPADWVKSTTIDDLRENVPVMFSTAGWYTIEAQQPFVRFASTGEFGSLGTMGVQKNENNWNGTFVSNKLQVYIKPPGSAQADVYVLDDSTDPPAKLFHVPVRVFKTEVVPQGNALADTWDKIEFVMEKFTDNDGKVTLATADGCLSQDNYTVIAKYGDSYQESTVTSTESGWVSEGCNSLIEKTIAFGDEEPPSIPGDLDGDGDIDKADYTIFRSSLGKCEGDAGFIAEADYDQDGCVTYADYRTWYIYFRNQ